MMSIQSASLERIIFIFYFGFFSHLKPKSLQKPKKNKKKYCYIVEVLYCFLKKGQMSNRAYLFFNIAYITEGKGD